MTDREFRLKVSESDGKGLTASEMERLDAALERTEFLSGAVSGLPEDSLSMAWRSSLNERLLAEAAKSKTSGRRAWLWRPALGLGLAGALAVVAFYPGISGQSGATAVRGQASVEAEMASAHVDVVNAMYVAGHGLAAYEASPTVSNAPNVVRWEETDLGDF